LKKSGIIDEDLVSIIIVNFNGEHLLEKCLSSLQKITYKNFEIIIVDNNSSDQSVQLVKNKFHNVKIIQLDKNYGFAEANNIGAKKAKGQFFLFLNNDTTIDPTFLNKLVNASKQDKKIAICQSLLLTPTGEIESSGDFINSIGFAFHSKEKPNEETSILSARGASMLVKKNAFFDLGGFDKEFFASFEDVDLGWRAWIFGYKVVIVPSSVVYHEGGQTVKKFRSEIKFHGVKNTLLLFLVNFEANKILLNILKMPIFLIRKRFGNAKIEDLEEKIELPSIRTFFQSLVWAIKNYRQISKRRKNIKSRRIRSTDELIQMGLIKKID